MRISSLAIDRFYLLFDFVTAANRAIKSFNEGYINYFDYSNIGVTTFFRFAETFTDADINDAILAIHANRWDSSEFIMGAEGLGNTLDNQTPA